MTQPRKIIVAGLPGSGKTTIAGILGEALSLPVFNTDSYCFNADWVRKKPDEIREIIKELVSGNEWIIDGMYGNVAEEFIGKADLLIYIRINMLTTFLNLVRRKIRHVLKRKEYNYSNNRILKGSRTMKTTFVKRGGSYKRWNDIIRNNKDSMEIIVIDNTRSHTKKKLIEKIKSM